MKQHEPVYITIYRKNQKKPLTMPNCAQNSRHVSIQPPDQLQYRQTNAEVVLCDPSSQIMLNCCTNHKTFSQCFNLEAALNRRKSGMNGSTLC